MMEDQLANVREVDLDTSLFEITTPNNKSLSIQSSPSSPLRRPSFNTPTRMSFEDIATTPHQDFIPAPTSFKATLPAPPMPPPRRRSSFELPNNNAAPFQPPMSMRSTSEPFFRTQSPLPTQQPRFFQPDPLVIDSSTVNNNQNKANNNTKSKSKPQSALPPPYHHAAAADSSTPRSPPIHRTVSHDCLQQPQPRCSFDSVSSTLTYPMHGMSSPNNNRSSLLQQTSNAVSVKKQQSMMLGQIRALQQELKEEKEYAEEMRVRIANLHSQRFALAMTCALVFPAFAMMQITQWLEEWDHGATSTGYELIACFLAVFAIALVVCSVTLWKRARKMIAKWERTHESSGDEEDTLPAAPVQAKSAALRRRIHHQL